MDTGMLRRSVHRFWPGYYRLWSTRNIPILMTLVVVGCTTSAPMQRDSNLSPRDPCREAEWAHELLGRYPGVRIFSEDGGLHLRVRGAAAGPLYIVDGLPLAPTNGGAFPAVNPCDIQEIQVLSDPVALSFYGPHAAHGVVLITTKQP